jgi:hypothetical protein
METFIPQGNPENILQGRKNTGSNDLLVNWEKFAKIGPQGSFHPTPPNLNFLESL